MTKRKRQRLPDVPTVSVPEVFERTIVELALDHNMHRRLPRPEDIDRIVKACLPELASTLEEFSEYIEREDWDAIVAMATQEQTRRAIRTGLRMRL